MAVAAFGAHGADPFKMKEMSLLYLAACVLLLFHGAGKYCLINDSQNKIKCEFVDLLFYCFSLL